MVTDSDRGARGEHTLLAVFDSQEAADGATAHLLRLGVPRDSIVLPPRDGSQPASREVAGSPASSAAGSGAALGAVIGTLLGWMIGSGALPLPGTGPVIGANVLAATIVGLLFGAGIGAILGALLGQGVPPQELAVELPPGAPVYMSVSTHAALADDAEVALIASGALDVQVRKPDLPVELSEERDGAAARYNTQEDIIMADETVGRNPDTVTGTESAIDPETGALGTGGTPLTTGYGVSGSTIGTGTARGQAEHEEGEYAGATPGTTPYELGGRGSTDRPDERAGTEHGERSDVKYGPVEGEDASGRNAPGGGDAYLRGPAYGDDTTPASDREATERYSSSDVESPPSYGNVELESTNESSGTDIPGTSDPRGLGDNTDDR